MIDERRRFTDGLGTLPGAIITFAQWKELAELMGLDRDPEPPIETVCLVCHDQVVPVLEVELQYVYFLENKSMSQIKIGHSAQPPQRIHDLSNQAGIDYPVLMVLRETEGFTESWAHSKANMLRIRGEWFEATPALYRWIDALAEWHPYHEEEQPPMMPKLTLVEEVA